ncbi:MAG: secretin N-terminal domain-containing protein, partial [Candidatus Rifleibacteriota bacterium]
MQRNKSLQTYLVAVFLLAAMFSSAAYSQSQQSRTTGFRKSVSFPTQPQANGSFYPVVRKPAAPKRTSSRKPGWIDLGNGAKMKVSANKSEQEKKLSPDVLETLKNLKQKEPEKSYQLNSEASPVTGALTQGLEPPAGSEQQEEIGVSESKLHFPAGKNIRIQALDFRNTPVSDALRSLAQLIDINLMLSPQIQGNVTILFSDVTIEEAFNTLMTSYDLSYAWAGNILRVFPKSEAPLITRIFSVQHTNATDIKTIIDRMLTEGRGSSEIDTRTNSLMVTDTAAKLAEIKTLLPQIDVRESSVDISSRPLTEVFYLDYADASTLIDPIKMLSTGVQIQEFSSSSASQAGAGGGEGTGRKDMMIITDTQNNLQRIRELVEKLDVSPIQITIDAHIFEIDKNEEERLGVNWQKSIPIAGTDENLFEMTVAPEDADAGGTGVFRFGSLDINQFTALLAMLKTHSFAKVLSNPVITTLNNREANITVGQSIPYVSASQVNAETGQVTNTIAQANANISLIVTPSVTGNDEVFLDIQPTISSVLGFTELGGNSTPNLSTRSAVTQVICQNNHTIVIGGMIKTDKSESTSKVPFLGDLPGIGKFFQKKTQRETRTELIIFITPHIVNRESNKPINFAEQNQK